MLQTVEEVYADARVLVPFTWYPLQCLCLYFIALQCIQKQQKGRTAEEKLFNCHLLASPPTAIVKYIAPTNNPTPCKTQALRVISPCSWEIKEQRRAISKLPVARGISCPSTGPVIEGARSGSWLGPQASVTKKSCDPVFPSRTYFGLSWKQQHQNTRESLKLHLKEVSKESKSLSWVPSDSQWLIGLFCRALNCHFISFFVQGCASNNHYNPTLSIYNVFIDRSEVLYQYCLIVHECFTSEPHVPGNMASMQHNRVYIDLCIVLNSHSQIIESYNKV